MDPDMRLEVPPGFDDSDDDGQVHPVARRLFSGATNADAFRKAMEWVGAHDVFIMGLDWDRAFDEPEPFTLSLFFRFELPDEDDED
ncbi:hypothetical protein [Saccharothrix yanglingensis]|uniref:Uncharacterized protein n=1 Tax=Saccharothrix yanglingensis TaxID=659496 RepID=A0ABU0X100_9PSEU|nr:hypothetical protein [Saccharothrix yanglingensis]MDQ2585811.1 hypothetical protein [Saccharothrix yanglingensis]